MREGPTVGRGSPEASAGAQEVPAGSQEAPAGAQGTARGGPAAERPEFPFRAVVGQEDLQLALVLAAVDPAIGGVLLRGQKGSAKTTVARGFATLLGDGVPFVEIPMGTSEDRLVGSLDLRVALTEGRHRFVPGLLAGAHGGVLYVDEVNLLSDHLVDILLDVAASGRNRVERDGLSHVHASRFVLVGSMNPEEGELRPQLLDRFGLAVEVAAPTEAGSRVEAVRRRLAFDADPLGFASQWAQEEADVRRRLAATRPAPLAAGLLEGISALCAASGAEGLRADLVLCRAAAALAGWEGDPEATPLHVRRVAGLALAHRRRRSPFEAPGMAGEELDALIDDAFGTPGGDGRSGSAPAAPAGTGAPLGGCPAEGGSVEDRGGRSEGAPQEDGGPDGPVAKEGGTAGPGPSGAAAQGLPDARGEVPEVGAAGDREGGTGSPGGGLRAGAGAEQAAVAGTLSRALPAIAPGTSRGRATAAVPGRRSAASVPGARGRGREIGARTPDPGASLGRVAVRATVGASVARRAGGGPGGVLFEAGDLREAVTQQRSANLVVLAVDASGSMGAQRRMAAAKGAVLALLLDAYQRRDRVALVTFRGEGAEVVLRPTGSTEVAQARLQALPTGGRTPLAAGISAAGEVIGRAGDGYRPLLVLVTDGRATAAPAGADPVSAAIEAAGRIRRSGVAATVVDAEASAGGGNVRLGLARELAEAMAAHYVRLDDLDADSLARTVRQLKVMSDSSQ